MVPAWNVEPVSREPSPEERASAEEETPVPVLTAGERETVSRILRRMKIFRPRLYRVLAAWLASFERRDEPSGYSHRVYRGWYAEQAKKLRLSENGVKRRLKTAQRWLAERIRKEVGER
jgi:hypothetical protein